jgi:copper(I)-binding protein
VSKDNYLFTALVLLVLVGLSGCIASCSVGPEPDISISQAVVKRPLNGKTKTVAYFKIRNNAAQPKILKGVSSQIAGAIELHTTIKSDSTMRMQRLGELIIPADASITFSPGGKHLMLFRVAELNTTHAILEFRFTDETRYAAEFSIEDY